MLINTVVLILRDMLPLAILIVWLVAFVNATKVTITWLLTVFIIGTLAIGLFFNVAPLISDWLDGRGLEVVMVALITLLYLSLVIGSGIAFKVTGQANTQNAHYIATLSQLLLAVGVGSLWLIKGTNFLIFFSGYLSRSTNDFSIILGVFVALGIVISFSILFFFVLRWLNNNRLSNVLNVLWAMFLAGQFTQIIPLLTQVDIISGTNPLWSSQEFINDSSEYGHVLKSLFGYEANPNASFISCYLVAFSLYFVVFWLFTGRVQCRTRVDEVTYEN